MITSDNFPALLLALNFKQHDRYYQKIFANNIVLMVDMVKKKLIYPQTLQVNDATTSNFDSAENFVVFECVNRLLEKGYQPEHIELERKWALGRTQKSGKADIVVSDLEGNTLLIIECKTDGKEYEKEKQRMIANGGQLFSYLQQERATRFLCLYASDFKDNELSYSNAIIQIKDRPEVINLIKENPDTLAFITAKNATEYHRAWKENFNYYFAPNGIFESDITAYNPEFKPIKRKDLKPFADKEARQLFNQFEEILRHNNISDKSNAFNRIMSLLLCKILDERKNPDDETDVQIKEGSDTPIKIQDRLQALYSKGMNEFLNEKIIYFSAAEIEQVVNDFPIQKARFQLKDMFEKQKFYSNNEFCFQEVHNEKLFLENAKVLNEIIALLQYKQFRYSRQNSEEFKQQKRFLGDFFELLLNTGYKQDAGQFFTPLPIARFMIKCLPLHEKTHDNLIQKRPDFLPSIIDYACGSGHFLTEAIEEIQAIIDELKPEYGEDINLNIVHWKQADWTSKYIYGIEKDYRLARTAKLACFMNGDGESTIIFGNGLEDYNNSEHSFRESFDFLIANPPYSISRFKTHLNLKRNKFELLSHLTESASEIEVLFIERAKQLLEIGGIAGIILPSSILSNGGIYIKAREIILRYFYIKAIVELGSNTFMATGTNTVILFLEKRDDKMAINGHYVAQDFIIHNKPRPNDFIDTRAVWAAYSRHIGFELSDYETLINQTPNEVIKNSEWFKNYSNWFNGLTEIKNLKTSSRFLAQSDSEQTTQLTRLFYEKLCVLEKDKFEFFMIIGNQKTFIVRSPEEGKAEKAFLGYEFSKRRGDEGIKLYQDATKKHQTALYDETDLNNPNKVNYLIKSVLKNEAVVIPDELADLINITPLLDCFNFERLEFDKAILLSAKKSVEIKYNHKLEKLGDITEVIAGQSPNSENYNETQQGFAFYQGKKDFGDIYLNPPTVWTTQLTKKSIKNDLLMSVRAPVGDININPYEEICIGRGLAVIRSNNLTLQKYLFEFINQNKFLFKGNKGTTFDAISTENLREIKIPLPTKDIQEKIVAECELVDNEVEIAEQVINFANSQIKIEIESWFNKGFSIEKIEKVFLLEYGKPLPENKRITGDYPVMGSNGISGYHNEYLIKAPAIIVGRKGSAGKVVYVTNNCYPIDTTFYVKPIRECSMKYLYWVLTTLELEKMIVGIGVPGINRHDIYQRTIPIPDVETQKTLVAEIEILENKIAESQNIINESTAKKQAILKSYLYFNSAS